MTAYYTQAQIDEIGVLVGQEILSSSEALKQFVQDKIDALEPVAPPAPTEPETGGGTTPAPAAGMFLDDGRALKQRYITLTTKAGTLTGRVSHGLDIQNIVSTQVLVKAKFSDIFYPIAHKNYFQTDENKNITECSWELNDEFINVNAPRADGLELTAVKILITYLA